MTTVFLSFFGISISVSLVVAVLILLTPFLNRRYAVKWKYLIWIFLALRLLIPLSGANREFMMDTVSETKLQAGPESEENHEGAQNGITIPSGRILVEIPTEMTTPITAQSGKSNTGITMLELMTFVWMAGSLIFIALHFVSYFHYKRQVIKTGRAVRDTYILRQMSERKRELQIRRTIRVIEYHKAVSPMIIGFLKPVLVLPKGKYSAEELFFILRHELVHFKRGDVCFKLLFVTANAVHWFNPFIWVMQKEAAVDMELSCDEQVIQGAGYAVRKAYTETLLSMLHKQCAGKTVLSTQFYGGIKIMKKRFRNILIKSRKKSGVSVLICTVILTISLGMLSGCSVAKEETGKENTENEEIENGNMGEGSEQSEREAVPTEQASAVAASADDSTSENTIMLTFFREGEQEQKQARLVTGDGYAIYLPEDEWQPEGPDRWRMTVNEQVRIWIGHFGDGPMDLLNQKLENDGYVTVEEHVRRKQEGDLVYYVRLKEYEHDMWQIFYCYPAEAEEGWGRELPVIADTFSLLMETDDEKNKSPEAAGEYLSPEDCQEIRTIVDEFSAAYFAGNRDVIKKFLAGSYEGEIDTFESTGTISDLTVKGLSDDDRKEIENGRYVVSLEFRDSTCEDMLLYITVILIREEGSWKIQFYGLEG